MATFLGIPREIRDNIYLLVLLSEISPPISVLEAQCGRQLSTRIKYKCCQEIHFPIGPLPPASYGLLSVCRQVHAEMKDAISLLKKGGPPRYKIDGVFDHEYASYWKWISIPYFSPHIDTVDVDIRFFGAVSEEELREALVVYHYHVITLQLLSLFERFLERGPQFSAPERSSKLRVRALNVNIISTNGIPAIKRLSAEKLGSGDFSGAKYLPSPEGVADEINDDIHTVVSHGVDFIGFVDHINVSVDGRLKQHWDFTLENWRDNLPPTQPGCWAD
ncbi:hypothetical protein FQN54_009056 [Arachnomyces sp. PD_36]|nr:hypothetical protein FQN54_009056 [Arachnomyces sp. PD_36]